MRPGARLSYALSVSVLLAHELVQAPGVEPRQWCFFLHGILGTRGNLRSFGRRLTGDFPSWGVVLVDLRMHGESQGFVAPHNLASSAEDLDALARALPGPVRAILGHSFGGKVALAYLGTHATELSNAFILDSDPGPRLDFHGSEDTVQVVQLLEAMPRSYASRQEFLTRVTDAGHGLPFAQWLSMNLASDDGTYRLRLELPAIRALLDDYFTRDLWPVLEEGPLPTRVDVVLGGKSQVLDEAAKARLTKLAARRSEVHVHTLANAGHWVHVEDPEGLYAILRDGFRSR